MGLLRRPVPDLVFAHRDIWDSGARDLSEAYSKARRGFFRDATCPRDDGWSAEILIADPAGLSWLFLGCLVLVYPNDHHISPCWLFLRFLPES